VHLPQPSVSPLQLLMLLLPLLLLLARKVCETDGKASTARALDAQGGCNSSGFPLSPGPVGPAADAASQ
jgi:hypothetical protein